MKRFQLTQPVSQQRGAALIVCLILLLILTITGTAAIEDLSLQTNMARNSQFHMQAFHTAASEINGQLIKLGSNEAPLTSAMTSATGVLQLTGSEIVMSATDTPFEQEVAVRYEGYAGSAPGCRLDVCAGYHFEMDSTAKLENSGTRSEQVQGLLFTGPATH